MLGNNSKRHTFLMQGSILAIAGILVRLIGLFYRIPMIAIIGTEGNGYYTTAYSVYSLFLILSSYSFPTAISKIISQRLAQGRLADVKNVIRAAFFMSFLVGVIAFSIMFFGAELISNMFRKPLLQFALRTLAPTLFIMSFLGVLRGIFQGMGNMVPTAISQIFEQIANAIFSIVFALILFNKGNIANMIYDSNEYNYAFGASGGAIGTVVGAVVALLVLIFMFSTLNSRYKRYFKNNNNYALESKSKIYAVLFATIAPIVLSSTIYNITSVVDDFLLSNIETMLNTGSNIVILAGVYGQYHLLFNIPVAIASSLTTSIIPSISHSVVENDVRGVVLKVKYSIKYTLLIVIPAFIGLFILAEPICKLLFNSENVYLLTEILKLGSISVVFFSLSTVTNGILQSLGLFSKSVKNAFVALIIHIIACIILLAVFKLNIYGVIISLIIFSLTLYLLNQFDLNKIIRIKNKKSKVRNIITNIFMFISACIMGIIVKYVYEILNMGMFAGETTLFLAIKVIACIFVAFFSYSFLIILFGVVRKNDAEYIPFVSKFFFFLRK